MAKTKEDLRYMQMAEKRLKIRDFGKIKRPNPFYES